MKKRKLNHGLIIGIALILLVSIPVVLSFFWLPYDVNEMDYDALFQSPSLRHLFGTDNFGRDIFWRVVEGAKATFLIAIFTVACGAVIGGLVGAFTGYYGGAIDEVLMRINDGLASFPSILLALVVVSILDKGTLNICIALGVVFIPSFARIMRSEFMSERGRDYVANAKLMGASDIRIMFVHIFPNTLPVLGSAVLVGINNAVLAEAGLSYLGLGVQPPDPSLGRMLAEAQVYIFGAPWYVVSASLTMIAAILGISLVSENINRPAYNLKKIKARVENERRTGFEAACVKDSEYLIEVNNLHVGFVSDSGIREVINGINLELCKGEILGIVGESGSGKSMTALSIMGLAPENAVVTGGEIYYKGRPLVGLDENELVKIRGNEIAMIFQEPMTSLNPVQTIGEQLDEVLDLHASYLTAGEQRERVLEAMTDTGLNEPSKLYNMYPHELSGGMRQRVMIAMAIIARAQVILADEPTTALDADIAQHILEIFRRINEKYGTAVILISHDLEVISLVCDRALVVKDGLVVEELAIIKGGESAKLGEGRSTAKFTVPTSEYGKRLLEAAFSEKSYVEKHQSDEILEKFSKFSARKDIVILEDYCVYYNNRGKTLFSKTTRKEINHNVNMTIQRGDCVGIVGPSGCGKTTLVKAIAGLQEYTSGVMKIDTPNPGMVFQDPMSSLNPAMKVGRILEEPLILAKEKNKAVRATRVAEVMEAVELDPGLSTRRVSELSGGQRQRIFIALNIILNRELIILDEPVSALDVTIREQVIELLMRLKKERGLTFVIISHDKRLVSRICNKVYTMEDGHAVQLY